eukprot:TRINITY_DN8057_c0_g1_i1.p1 TRINITY_DN8057_c0_g1~~TRINITY_DN8057_c0_g1_i1.p1  ORF type:complete len:245 (+),score=45.03 TRINITY_DN8057_c0_g1_i1:160-894(+)
MSENMSSNNSLGTLPTVPLNNASLSINNITLPDLNSISQVAREPGQDVSQQFRFGEEKSFNFGSESSLGNFMKNFLTTDGNNTAANSSMQGAPTSTSLPPPTRESPASTMNSVSGGMSSSPEENSAMDNGSNDSRLVSVANPLIPVPNGQHFVDITEYLNLPQTTAAKKLGIPTSTLSKRWKEAVRKRKWPYRTVCKLDKEITTLLHNIPQGQNAGSLPEEVEETLSLLLRKRQEELRPVVIRI